MPACGWFLRSRLLSYPGDAHLLRRRGRPRARNLRCRPAPRTPAPSGHASRRQVRSRSLLAPRRPASRHGWARTPKPSTHPTSRGGSARWVVATAATSRAVHWRSNPSPPPGPAKDGSDRPRSAFGSRAFPRHARRRRPTRFVRWPSFEGKAPSGRLSSVVCISTRTSRRRTKATSAATEGVASRFDATRRQGRSSSS